MRPTTPLIGKNVLRSTEMTSKRQLFGGIDGKTQQKIGYWSERSNLSGFSLDL